MLRGEPSRTDSFLALAGAYEFVPTPDYTSLKPPTPEVARVLFQAYESLDYDLVLLTPAEERLLREAGVDIPESWVTASSRPGMVELNKAGLRIGVVIFPFVDPPMDTPPTLLMRQVADKAGRLRERCDLVIGLSAWGGMAEKRFLNQAGPVFDVLLGSGPGPGLAGGLFAGARTFWTRPTSRGKSVNAFGVAALPRRDGDWQWIKEKNIHLLFKPMDETVVPDPSLAELFDKLPKDKQE